MISLLRGIVASVGLDHIDIVVGGIGFRVHVTPAFAQAAPRDEEITVYTSMIVREDSMTLYGFESADERDVFTKLLSVSGIGPKIALAALAVLRPDDLRRAVRDQDLATLQRIPGVGKKSAQRMALEIGDKLGTPAALPGVDAAPAPRPPRMRSPPRSAPHWWVWDGPRRRPPKPSRSSRAAVWVPPTCCAPLW